MPMIPQYNTRLFKNLYDEEEFIKDYKNNGLPVTISEDSAKVLYWLLYAKYANNPVANLDLNQFKMRLFATVFQYGPTWEKRLEIQERLRDLSEEDIRLGYKSIANRALHPDVEPSTGSLEELPFIDSQNTTTGKKGIIDGYSQLWMLLKVDVTTEFLDKFKNLFKVVVMPENPLLYITYEEDEEQ